MAANCMGSFGAYKLAWSRHAQQKEQASLQPAEPAQETVWVTKRYIPTDLRVTAPVPRHKLLAPNVKDTAAPAGHWVPVGEAPLGAFSRDHEEERIYASQPSTRCEEWSTLRQMLPSRGRPWSDSPPNWGSGFGGAPSMIPVKQRRFPHINSPMTRYVDAMHLTNRLFKLH